MIHGQSDPADQLDPWELEACALLLQPAVEPQLSVANLEADQTQTQTRPAGQQSHPTSSSRARFDCNNCKPAQETILTAAAAAGHGSHPSRNNFPHEEPHTAVESQNLQPETAALSRYGSEACKHLRLIKCGRNTIRRGGLESTAQHHPAANQETDNSSAEPNLVNFYDLK